MQLRLTLAALALAGVLGSTPLAPLAARDGSSAKASDPTSEGTKTHGAGDAGSRTSTPSGKPRDAVAQAAMPSGDSSTAASGSSGGGSGKGGDPSGNDRQYLPINLSIAVAEGYAMPKGRLAALDKANEEFMVTIACPASRAWWLMCRPVEESQQAMTPHTRHSLRCT